MKESQKSSITGDEFWQWTLQVHVFELRDSYKDMVETKSRPPTISDSRGRKPELYVITLTGGEENLILN